MNRQTTDKLVSGTDQADLTTGNACWETPPLVFEQLNADFGPFDIDLTADARRALCPVWFGPGSPYGIGGYDALTANALQMAQSVGDWSAFQVTNGYSNPPYGPFIQRLLVVAKANAEHCGFTSTLLLPMRVTKAFKAHVLRVAGKIGASDLLFCDSRITFFENGVPRLNEKQWRDHGRAVADPAVFDSIVVRYRPGATTLNVDTWHVPKHVTADDLARAVALKKAA